MRNDVVVRKRQTADQREKVIAGYLASGVTQRDFAAQVGISAGTLARWLRQSRSQSSSEPVSFVELPGLGGVAASPAAYKVHLADGTVLEVPQKFSSPELRELLRVVRGS
jgi:transposase-like protein